MKKLLGVVLIGIALVVGAGAKEGEKEAKAKKVCPISGKAVDADVKTKYEGKTYGFCCEKCLAKFNKAREESLYQKIGG